VNLKTEFLDKRKKKVQKVTNEEIYRIFSPSEYKQLLTGIDKVDNRFRVETMLMTGMRYEELLRFEPKFFKPKTRDITLPASITKTRRGRAVQLTPTFSAKLELFLSKSALNYPNRSTMNANLKRWCKKAGIDWTINCKTFRKTIETWLIFAGFDSMKVAISQGHTQTVQIAHYQNMSSCLKNELKEVKEYTEGWMK
jgi:integrase